MVQIRPSKAAPRRALVLLLVHALIAIHLAHWMTSGSTLSPLEPSEAMEFAQNGVVNAGAIFFLLTILSTLVLGRWFCGWGCHVVALQDASLWLLGKLKIRPKPLRSKLLGFVPLFAAGYMFVYPFAYRLWTGIGMPEARLHLTKESFWETFPPLPIALLTFVVCGFVVIYFLGAKGFCAYACPYGAIFGFVDRFAVGRIRVTDACEGCAHCTARCTSNVRVHEEVRDHGMVVDPGCMKCLDCVSVCPKDALYFGFGAPSGTKKAKRVQQKPAHAWGEEALLAAVFVVAILVFRGLYDAVPFLLSLGWAGIVAMLALVTWRTLRRADVSLVGHPIKRGGRLTARGIGFLATMLVLAGFTLHSALIQYHSTMARRSYAQTEAVPDAELQGVVRAGLAHTSFVHRYGLPMARNEHHLARFHLLDGRPDDYERHMQAALARADQADWRFELGRFYEGQRRLDDAARQYELGLELRPDAELFDRLARLLGALGRPEQAREVYADALRHQEELVRRHPDEASAHYGLGMLYVALGRVDQGIAALERTLELDPDWVPAIENLAGMLAMQGRFQEAIERFRHALELQPNDTATLGLILQAYLGLGDPEGARRELADLQTRGLAAEDDVRALLQRLETSR